MEDEIGSEYGIVAFAFGTPARISANVKISSIASKIARRLNAEVYTQFDVWIDDPEINVSSVEETDGHPPPTLKICRGAVQWAMARCHKKLLIVAAAPHIKRCMRDMLCAVEEAGMVSKIEIEAFQSDIFFPFEDWFCPDSTQSRTQSRKNWERRERILMMLPMWMYRLLTWLEDHN